MVKLTTAVASSPLGFSLNFDDRIILLGSCFADFLGRKLSDAGFTVQANPFGPLYNPASLSNAVARLESGTEYTGADCVQMGAGAGLVCSFEHHTSFARPTAEAFLAEANRALARDSGYWHACNKVIVPLGTARVWKVGDRVVSNCLKRPSGEFTHEYLSVDAVAGIIRGLQLSFPEKEFIFCVCPIRQPGAEGALRANNISKSILHLALHQTGVCYFPAYEILLDELRDYRFYADDLCHPSALAEQIIWERFQECCISASLRTQIVENEKAARRRAHRSILSEK